jgi:hypothetical protein
MARTVYDQQSMNLPSDLRNEAGGKLSNEPFSRFIDQQPEHSEAQRRHDIFHGHWASTEHTIEPSDLGDQDLDTSGDQHCTEHNPIASFAPEAK